MFSLHYTSTRPTMECSTVLLLLVNHLLTRNIIFAKEMKDMSSSLNLQCPPCKDLFCSPRNPQRLKCPGGITTGVCNCCPVCAKIEGERCGGQYNYLGKCDAGLYCEEQVSTSSMKKLAFKPSTSSQAEGICRKKILPLPKPTKDIYSVPLGDQPNPTPRRARCRPECTPDYCQKNPRAICSARVNAITSRSCHGNCQHTSCRACRFIEKDPPCPKCAPNDFKCIKRFGRCIKKDVCKRERHFPCGKRDPDKSDTELVLKCELPECL